MLKLRSFTTLALICATLLAACSSGPSDSSSGVSTVATPGTAEPSATALAGAGGPGLASEVDDYMTRLSALGFSGALLLASGDEVLLEKGYGLADWKNKVPADAGTVYNTGSVTKQFTAAATLKLAQEGKLDTGDPISRFFENVPKDKADITLHHLLTHSAGFLDAHGSDEEAISRDAAMKLFFAMPLRFEPGQRFGYSNVGYSILAAIIEKVSGQQYEDYLIEKLFKPAGMADTGYRRPGWDPARVAHYPENPLGLDSPLDQPGPYWHLIGNGGILSTVRDMYRWFQALQGDTILDKASREKLFAPHIEHPGPSGPAAYGYGWGIASTQDGGKMIWHNGGDALGLTADVRWYVERGYFVVIMSNDFLDGQESATPVAQKLEDIIFGRDYTMPPAEPAAVDALSLAGYAGTYETEAGAKLDLAGMMVGGEAGEIMARKTG